jgi:hypothetical protein
MFHPLLHCLIADLYAMRFFPTQPGFIPTILSMILAEEDGYMQYFNPTRTLKSPFFLGLRQEDILGVGLEIELPLDIISSFMVLFTILTNNL